MQALTFGAIFLLAMFGPALFGASTVLVGDPGASPPVKGIASTDPSMVVIALVSATGLGGILQVVGQGMWELLFPYGPRSGLRWIVPRRNDFRTAISTSEPPYADLKYKAEELPLAQQVTGAAPDAPGRWRFPGHEYLLAPAFFFYKDAPDPVVQWVRRRYQSFIDALSVAFSIVLGVGLGLVFLPAQDLGKQLAFSAVLAVFGVVTVLWASERRALAHEMEAYWFARQARHASDAPPPTHIVIDHVEAE